MRAKQLPSGFFFFSSYNYPVEFLPTPLPSPAAKSDSYTNKDHTTAKKKWAIDRTGYDYYFRRP